MCRQELVNTDTNTSTNTNANTNTDKNIDIFVIGGAGQAAGRVATGAVIYL